MEHCYPELGAFSRLERRPGQQDTAMLALADAQVVKWCTADFLSGEHSGSLNHTHTPAYARALLPLLPALPLRPVRDRLRRPC